jgi:hypothetical protein
MRIQGVKYGDFEYELFEWLCRAEVNNIPVEGPTVKENMNKTMFKMGTELQHSSG